MSGILQDNYWFSDAASSVELGNSLRFRGAQSLLKSTANTTDSTTFTLSCWVKLGAITQSNGAIFSQDLNGSNTWVLRYGTGGATDTIGTTYASNATSEPDGVFRDPSAWYHLYVVGDGSTQTSYVNNVAGSSVSQINTYFRARPLKIGARAYNNTQFFEGYMAEYHVSDQVVPITSFAEYNSDGVWVPKKVTGMNYGTDGFYLDFSDPADIGADRSGNGNDFTATGFELTDTTSVEYDLVDDSPTNNFSLINAVQANPTTGSFWDAPFNGNLEGKISSSSNSDRSAYWIPTVQKLPTSGKWFLGMYNFGNTSAYTRIFGINLVPDPDTTFSVTTRYPDGIAGLMQFGGNYRYYTVSGGTQSPNYNIGSQPGNGTPHGSSVCAYDADTGNVWFGYVYAGPGRTGFTGDVVWMQYDGTVGGDPVAGTDPTFTVTGPQYVRLYTTRKAVNGANTNIGWYYLNDNSATTAQVVNKPAGYEIFNTGTFPAATITNPSNHFDVILDTSSNILTAAQAKFANGMWWINATSGSGQLRIVDSLRSSSVDTFTCPGNTVGSYTAPSQAGSVAWCWATPGNPVTNNNGSIATTVDANTASGFSMMTYTGTGANATIGHGLNQAPTYIIVKRLAGSNGPSVGSDQLTDWDRYISLSSSSMQVTSGGRWNSTAPDSSVISLGNDGAVNTSGDLHVCYAWHEVAGYSAIGQYRGNQSADGPFQYCGFQPAFVMIKLYRNAGDGQWTILDTTRNTLNVADLNASTSDTSNNYTNGAKIDFLANGFKLRSANVNGSSGSNFDYFWMAFAEHPFGGSNVSPATAR